MCSIDKFVNIKYKLVKTDEFYDEYLKEIGLNYFTRKVAKSMPSTTELIKIDDNEYGLVTTIPLKSIVQKIIPGEEIIQHTMDGRTVKNIFEIEENILIEYQIEEKRKIKITREYFENEMTGETEFGGMKSKHWSIAEHHH